MADRKTRVLATAPAEQSGHRGPQPRTATNPGSETATAQSCQQQLSFGPKAYCGTDLAGGHWPGTSCQQQLSSGASVDFRSASAPAWSPHRILPTTTSWHGIGFRRIKGITPCSRPNRLTTS